jgi:hypothetical protein
MDLEKEQSIKTKLEEIKTQTDETSETRIRKLKSLINQMNLHLLENPNDKEIILTLQKLGYEAIIYVLDNDKQSDESQTKRQKDQAKRLIEIINSEFKSLN